MSLQNQINVNDLKGQGNIDQCRNYIVKAGMIDLKELNKEWKLINKYKLTSKKNVDNNNEIIKRTQ